eukprot:363824-Chlamydomonas_euryale.AAC.6
MRAHTSSHCAQRDLRRCAAHMTAHDGTAHDGTHDGACKHHASCGQQRRRCSALGDADSQRQAANDDTAHATAVGHAETRIKSAGRMVSQACCAPAVNEGNVKKKAIRPLEQLAAVRSLRKGVTSTCKRRSAAGGRPTFAIIRRLLLGRAHLLEILLLSAGFSGRMPKVRAFGGQRSRKCGTRVRSRLRLDPPVADSRPQSV